LKIHFAFYKAINYILSRVYLLSFGPNEFKSGFFSTMMFKKLNINQTITIPYVGTTMGTEQSS
ncbi:MAG TPA: hypothetical protein PKA72_13310, partial [bacterium]|nr:hypothetical protein [bacterium]